MTIRLLHTSDWHLGRTIRNRPRTEEFAAVLDEVVRIAVDERVDGVLVAGDLYDSRAPGPEADAVLVETLVHLHEAGIPVVAIGGNHDSAQRLEAFAPLYRGGRGDRRRQRPPARTPAASPSSRSRDGATTALIACVPFVPERRFASTAALFDAPESWYATYADGMGNLLDAFAAAFRPDRVNVLLAHLYADGSLLGGGEREVTVGLEYAVSPARLPATAELPRPRPHPPAPAGGRRGRAGPLLGLAPPARLRRDRAAEVGRHRRGRAGDAGGGPRGPADGRPPAGRPARDARRRGGGGRDGRRRLAARLRRDRRARSRGSPIGSARRSRTRSTSSSSTTGRPTTSRARGRPGSARSGRATSSRPTSG